MKKETISVDYNYVLRASRDIFNTSNPVLAESLTASAPSRNHKVVVYIDSGVHQSSPEISTQIESYIGHHDNLSLLATPMVITGGEAGKNERTVNALYEHMLKAKVDRHATIIAIGGGATLDTVGYAASTFHRGIKILRLPTTVLAQNDAGIGVKNGINAFGIKNLLGCFSPPSAVINDYNFLDTLDLRDRRSGIAEAIKVAVIRDSEFFNWLEQNACFFDDLNHPAMEYLIERCAELHLNQIVRGGDPFEMGSARPLDYGHWSAHKLESLSHYELRHGEAVAIGMAMDAQYAANIGLLDTQSADRLIQLIQAVGLPIWHPTLEQKDDTGEYHLLSGLEEFRQHLGGDLCITLLSELGTGIEVDNMTTEEILNATSQLKERHLASLPK